MQRLNGGRLCKRRIMETELKKDMENMENVLIRLGGRTDIWQDRIIYVIAKAVFDLCRWAIKKEKLFRSLEQMNDVSDAYWIAVAERYRRASERDREWTNL